jgi:endonuclease/exonuclease/phosphatase family metal-dependent hydrolase
MHQLTFCSANLRNANAADGADAWPHRHASLAHTLQVIAPDILGVQECMDVQSQWLRASFPEHTITPGIPYGNHAPYECAAIAWRTNQFTLQSSGAFHLSLTPRVPSRSWDTAWMRVANWVVLRHRTSGYDLCVCNTHLDHVGAQSRLASIDVIHQQLAHLAHLPTILMGDFNTPPDSPVHAQARAYGFIDSWQAAGHRDGRGVMTFHGFRGAQWPGLSGERDDARIDWILHRDTTQRLAVSSAHIITMQSADGRFPSDHYPVVAKYRLAP